jgi:hypothetical protein
MTFEKLWDALCVKRKVLKDPEGEITMKAKNLKNTLRQAYEQGSKHQGDLMDTMKKMMDKGKPKSNPMEDLFGDFFGGRR